MSTTGERIKALRIAAGLSADELGKRIGKNRATVYRYESEDIENMPVGILRPLANVLHTTPAYLMGWTDERTKATEVPALSPEENELLAIYRDANTAGQQQLLYLARLISSDATMKKSDSSGKAM